MIRTEPVQWCHQINNPNQTVQRPDLLWASPGKCIQPELESWWGSVTMTDASIISLFSQTSAPPQLSHYHTHTPSKIHYLLQLFSLCLAHLITNQRSCQPEIIVDHCQSLSHQQTLSKWLRHTWVIIYRTKSPLFFSSLPRPSHLHQLTACFGCGL